MPLYRTGVMIGLGVLLLLVVIAITNLRSPVDNTVTVAELRWRVGLRVHDYVEREGYHFGHTDDTGGAIHTTRLFYAGLNDDDYAAGNCRQIAPEGEATRYRCEVTAYVYRGWQYNRNLFNDGAGRDPHPITHDYPTCDTITDPSPGDVCTNSETFTLYTVVFTDANGDQHDCQTDEERWQSVEIGDTFEGRFFDYGLSCTSLPW